MSAKPKDVGLELSRSDLYPPLTTDHMEFVGFSTTVPDTDSLRFDYALDGVSGEHAGIRWFAGHNRGNIIIGREFIAFYPGTWPVSLMVRAYRGETLVGSAALLLHDTRQVKAYHCEVSTSPNPVRVTPDVVNTVGVNAVFFDEQGVQLPDAELAWDVVLPQAPPGLVVDGKQVLIHPQAQVGEVALVVKERSGVEQDATLILIPGQDIGIELTTEHFYPPLLSSRPQHVFIHDAWPGPDELGYSFTVNGQRLGHGGVTIHKSMGVWHLIFDNTFVHNVIGGWPAELRVEASINKDIIDTKVLWLYDTRTMVCAKVDFEFSPSDTIQIPQQGEATVVAAPRLYDAAGIQLPNDEVSWYARLVEPVEGVSMHGHVVFIVPEAKPGSFRVVLVGPNDLNRARVLTLT